MSTRQTLRASYPLDTRMSLIEHDLDEFESALTTIKTLLIGILVSTTTAAILLAINLVVANSA